MSDVSISGVGPAAGAEATSRRTPARLGFALLLPLLIVAMELAVSLVEPRVLSLRNIVNILVQSSFLLLFASAQMVVILTGGFDLSLGMAVSVISVATALRPPAWQRPALRSGSFSLLDWLSGLASDCWSACSMGCSCPGSASIHLW